jgi:hypothetical protein
MNIFKLCNKSSIIEFKILSRMFFIKIRKIRVKITEYIYIKVRFISKPYMNDYSFKNNICEIHFYSNI